jgi:hypothetical protein
MIAKQLASVFLFGLVGYQVAVEYIAIAVIQYQAFVVQLPISLVKGNLKQLCDRETSLDNTRWRVMIRLNMHGGDDGEGMDEVRTEYGSLIQWHSERVTGEEVRVYCVNVKNADVMKCCGRVRKQQVVLKPRTVVVMCPLSV